jgi:hypothetical protein
MADRLEIVPSPFFPASPDWWFRRKRVSPLPLTLVIWSPPGAAPVDSILSKVGGYPVLEVDVVSPSHVALGHALREAAQAATIVALADARVAIGGDEWLWELAGLFESFPDAVLVGGRLLDSHGRVVRAAGSMEPGESIDSPDRGRSEHDGGYFGTALKQRTTDVVSGALCGFASDFITTINVDSCTTPDEAAVVVALDALRQNRRVIFSPFIQGRIADGLPEWPVGPENSSVPANRPRYHPKLSQDLNNLIRPRT